MTVRYSCLYESLSGANKIENFTNDPGFVAEGSGYGLTHVWGDYRLKSGSDCVNTGENQGWMNGAIDLGGGPRIRHEVVDRGAFETLVPPKGTVVIMR